MGFLQAGLIISYLEMVNIISFRDRKECDRSINLLVLLRVNSEAIAVLKSKYGSLQNL